MTLENEEKVLRTILIGPPLVYLAGEEFSETYMSNRKKHNIFLKSLRTSSENLDFPQHKDYANRNKEVRFTPKGTTFDYSLVIWDDYVAVVDSKKISGVIIKNKENANIMKKLFEHLWEHSE
jgi:hypothetical protein